MRLLFRGTYGELVDNIFRAAEKDRTEMYLEISDEPILRISFEKGELWQKALYVEQYQGNSVIYPIMNGYERKLPFIHGILSRCVSSVLVFSTFAILMLILWLVLFGSELWYVSIAVSVIPCALLKIYMRYKEKFIWTEIYTFLIREANCEPYNDGKKGFDIYIK